MNNKSWVKLSNIIGIVSIILLLYWVFIQISTEVFGLKVFREITTETFNMSILGILALMFGALMINIMFNLTRIAEKHNQDDLKTPKRTNKRLWILFLLSFPLIFLLLWGGDLISSKARKQELIDAAKSVVEYNGANTDKMLNYSFDRAWIAETSESLRMYAITDKWLPEASVIVSDSVDGSQMFLCFRERDGRYLNDTTQPLKKNYILETTKYEREYLEKVFYENLDEIRFTASDGNYQLFYPYEKDGKKIVIYFSTYEEYGVTALKAE